MPRKPWTEGAPFHVVSRSDTVHRGYDIYVKNRPFLKQAAESVGLGTSDAAPRLKRHEAYAIANLLNGQQAFRRWAQKFSDPYDDE